MIPNPAAKRRQNVATAEGRGICFGPGISRGAAEDSFAAPRLMRLQNDNHGLQPWLHSAAAPRLRPVSPYPILYTGIGPVKPFTCRGAIFSAATRPSTR